MEEQEEFEREDPCPICGCDVAQFKCCDGTFIEDDIAQPPSTTDV